VTTTFFRYRDIEQLHEDVETLGVNVRLEPQVKALLEPVRIGSLVAKNSLAVHPMEGCDGTLDGKPDELVFRRYRRFGAGGAGLIWFEATAILPEARANSRQLLINEANAKSLEELLNTAKRSHVEVFGSADGLVCGVQLTHSGRYSYQKPLIVVHDPALDAKKNIPPDYPVLSDDELERIEDDYVHAAQWAQKIGFDFIDVKQCHRYLMSELLSAKTREGRYGGSFENRARFARNVIAKIKAACPGLAIASRINAYDGVPYEMPPPPTSPARGEESRAPLPSREGLGEGAGVPCTYETPYKFGFGCDENDPMQEDLTEPIQLARLLRDWGVCLINVSMGNPYANPHVGRPFEKPPIDGYESPEHPLMGVERHFRIARQIQRAVPDVPVVGTGYSWLRHYFAAAGEANKRAGDVSLVGLGRGAIAYPDFARDLLEHGAVKPNKVCLAVSYCTALMRWKHNELGQFPCGCVPRDEVYAPIYQQGLKTAKR
jgi:2,4-dienoyl-CoA reductase-like NADH-dependent reductase (Old Yellow Enzyme family)